MEEKQKKVPAKRIQLVDVVLERKGSQMFEGRRVRSPKDAANIIRDFIGDSDREKFVVIGLLTKNEPQLLQVVHTGSINASIVHPREVMKALVISNCSCCIVAHNHRRMMEKYGIYVPISEVGYGTIFLYKEEIDEQLVPAEKTLKVQLKQRVLVTLVQMVRNIS